MSHRGRSLRHPSAAAPAALIWAGMTDKSRYVGDAVGAWYYCFKHKQVETRDQCHLMDRMGPYLTREDAENWHDRVEARNEAWDDEDE